MLQSLHIENFALIEDIYLSFTDGVTVFTGETGAANPSFSMPSVCSQENAHQRLSSGQGRKRSSLKARFFCPRKTKDWQTF